MNELFTVTHAVHVSSSFIQSCKNNITDCYERDCKSTHPVSEKNCTQRIKKRNIKKYIHMGKITLAEVSKAMIMVPDSQKQPALNNDVVRMWSKSWK